MSVPESQQKEVGGTVLAGEHYIKSQWVESGANVSTTPDGVEITNGEVYLTDGTFHSIGDTSIVVDDPTVTNHIFLIDRGEEYYVGYNTDGSSPSDPYVKVAEVTPSTSSVTESNRGDPPISSSSLKVGGGDPIASLDDISSDLSGEGDRTTAIGGASATATDGTAVGDQATASGNSSSAFGISSLASGPSAVALGANATGDAPVTVAIGSSASAEAAEAVSVGNGSLASQTTATALGSDAKAYTSGSAALGAGATSDGIMGLAAGSNASVDSDGGAAVGPSAVASGANSTAVGESSSAQGNKSVSIGSGSTVLENDSIAIGNVTVHTQGAAKIGGDQLIFGGLKGTVDDSRLNNNEMTVEMDEGTSEFILRGKDSDGNVQTATVAW